jgi:hypothetical protein
MSKMVYYYLSKTKDTGTLARLRRTWYMSSYYEKPLVPSQKKAKIFLLEDDERQVSWAQRRLAGHELTVARVFDSSSVIRLFSGFDLVVTDLVLPEQLGDRVSQAWWSVGLRAYYAALRCLHWRRIKGAALVSNFEHHLYEGGDEPTDPDMIRREIASIEMEVGKARGKTIRWSEGLVVSEVETPLNAVVDFDHTYYFVTHFLDPQGKVRTRQEIPEARSCPEFIRQEGWLILKPYEEVVDALLMDLE